MESPGCLISYLPAKILTLFGFSFRLGFLRNFFSGKLWFGLWLSSRLLKAANMNNLQRKRRIPSHALHMKHFDFCSKCFSCLFRKLILWKISGWIAGIQCSFKSAILSICKASLISFFILSARSFWISISVFENVHFVPSSEMSRRLSVGFRPSKAVFKTWEVALIFNCCVLHLILNEDLILGVRKILFLCSTCHVTRFSFFRTSFLRTVCDIVQNND